LYIVSRLALGVLWAVGTRNKYYGMYLATRENKNHEQKEAYKDNKSDISDLIKRAGVELLDFSSMISAYKTFCGQTAALTMCRRDKGLPFRDNLFINNLKCCILGEFTGHGHALKIQEEVKPDVNLQSSYIGYGNINRRAVGCSRKLTRTDC